MTLTYEYIQEKIQTNDDWLERALMSMDEYGPLGITPVPGVDWTSPSDRRLGVYALNRIKSGAKLDDALKANAREIMGRHIPCLLRIAEYKASSKYASSNAGDPSEPVVAKTGRESFIPDGKVFRGKNIVFTGELSSYTRDQAKAIVESYGARVSSGITKQTNLVIAGKAAGNKLQKARDAGIAVWDEHIFLANVPAVPRAQATMPDVPTREEKREAAEKSKAAAEKEVHSILGGVLDAFKPGA